MTNFVVACLPRARSAWLSSALNSCCPDMYVEHEGFGNCLLNNQLPVFHGSVGSDVLMPSVQRTIPDGWKHYFLWRDPVKVVESLERMGRWNEDAWIAQSMFASRYIEIFQPTILDSEDLFSTVKLLASDWGQKVYGLQEAKLKSLVKMKIVNKVYERAK